MAKLDGLLTYLSAQNVRQELVRQGKQPLNAIDLSLASGQKLDGYSPLEVYLATKDQYTPSK